MMPVMRPPSTRRCSGPKSLCTVVGSSGAWDATIAASASNASSTSDAWTKCSSGALDGEVGHVLPPRKARLVLRWQRVQAGDKLSCVGHESFDVVDGDVLHAVGEGRALEPALHAHAALAAVDVYFLDEERVGHGNPNNTGATDHRLGTAKGSGAVIVIDAQDHLVTVAARYGVDLVGLAAGDALAPCDPRARVARRTRSSITSKGEPNWA